MFISELKSFHAVARTRNVTRAAEQLGVSQPTVTAQLRALEGRYGVELFHRRGRALQLSDDGLRLLPLAEQLVRKETEIAFYLRDTSALRQGTLRLGATGPYYLMGIIGQFRQRYPGVDLSLTIGNSAAILQSLRDYRIELAASSFLVDEPGLHRIATARDPLCLTIRTDHRLAKRPSIAMADLAQETLLLREPGSMTRSLTEKLLEEAGVQPRQTVEIGSREAIGQAVLHRLGCTLMPSRESPVHPELVGIPISDKQAFLSEYLYCLKERQPVQSISRFLELVPPVAPASLDEKN